MSSSRQGLKGFGKALRSLPGHLLCLAQSAQGLLQILHVLALTSKRL